MYSPSSPEYDRATAFASYHETKYHHTNDSFSLPSLFHEEEEEEVPIRSPTHHRLHRPTPRHDFERTLLHAHGLTRALLFACVPCRGMEGTVPTNTIDSTRQKQQGGVKSYYVPTDIWDDSEVLPYLTNNQRR